MAYYSIFIYSECIIIYYHTVVNHQYHLNHNLHNHFYILRDAHSPEEKTLCLVWHINTPIWSRKSSSHGHQAQEYGGIQGSPYWAVATGDGRDPLRPSLLHIRVALCSARLLWCPYLFFKQWNSAKTSHIFTGEIIKLIFRVWTSHSMATK